jgi:hypothetical protein
MQMQLLGSLSRAAKEQPEEKEITNPAQGE